MKKASIQKNRQTLFHFKITEYKIPALLKIFIDTLPNQRYHLKNLITPKPLMRR